MPTGVIRRGGGLTGRISTGSGGRPSSYIPLDVEEIEVVDTIIGSMIGEVQQEPPVTINSAGTDTIAMTIYGAEGGVGDYDSTTGKYLLPINVRRTNIFNSGDYDLVAMHPEQNTGVATASTGTKARFRSLLLPVTAGKTYCISAKRAYVDRFRLAAYASATPVSGEECLYYSNGSYNTDYRWHVFTAPEGATSILLFLWAERDPTTIPALIADQTVELLMCESSEVVYYYSQTTTVALDEPLLLGQYANLSGSDLPTLCVGSNTIAIDTTVQPGEVYIRYFEMR